MHFLLKSLVVLCIALLNLQSAICIFDPVSLAIGAGALAGAYTGFDFLKENTYCRYAECCNKKSIPADMDKLYSLLHYSLHGQHIVMQQLLSAFSAHLNIYSLSRKPLVMSFHGTPGTGKNYVADMIASALYEKGEKSRFVHKYMGRAHFAISKNINEYNSKIYKDVVEALADCPRSLFIFDEVDKMPDGIFESLTSLVDYNGLPKDIDGSKAIFIFISNTAGVQISDQLAKLMKNGELRENIKLSAFEQILERASYNMDGGLKKAGLIEQHVIDHYIPFLPLEKQHVQKCIAAEFKKWNRTPTQDMIESLVQDVITYDRVHGLFATSGCKTIEKKVATAVWKIKNS